MLFVAFRRAESTVFRGAAERHRGMFPTGPFGPMADVLLSPPPNASAYGSWGQRHFKTRSENGEVLTDWGDEDAFLIALRANLLLFGSPD